MIQLKKITSECVSAAYNFAISRIELGRYEIRKLSFIKIGEVGLEIINFRDGAREYQLRN